MYRPQSVTKQILLPSSIKRFITTERHKLVVCYCPGHNINNNTPAAAAVFGQPNAFLLDVLLLGHKAPFSYVHKAKLTSAEDTPAVLLLILKGTHTDTIGCFLLTTSDSDWTGQRDASRCGGL